MCTTILSRDPQCRIVWMSMSQRNWRELEQITWAHLIGVPPCQHLLGNSVCMWKKNYAWFSEHTFPTLWKCTLVLCALSFNMQCNIRSAVCYVSVLRALPWNYFPPSLDNNHSPSIPWRFPCLHFRCPLSSLCFSSSPGYPTWNTFKAPLPFQISLSFQPHTHRGWS